MEEKLEPVDKVRNFCHVNTGLLPFKLHFFFIYGGLAGVLPFMPLIAKQLGIPATAVGMAYSAIPIFVFLSNPIIGFLVDYFRNIKFFLAVLLIMSSVAYSSVLTLPTITYGTEDEAYVQISYHNDSEPLLNIWTSLDRTCLEVSKRQVQCKLGFEYSNLSALNETNIAHLPIFINITHNFKDIDHKELMNEHWITSYIQNIDLMFELKETPSTLRSLECLPNIHHCSVSIDTTSVFSTYQYWTFFILVIIGGIGSIAATSLSTVASYKILDNDDEAYGRQRLFGTISWGLVTTLAGILTDQMTTGKSFLPGFCILAVLITIDVVILYFIYIPKTPVSTNMCNDLGKIFRSKEIMVFSLGVALEGVLANVISIYEFWFLEDMGASRTLLGLSVAVQCLLGEVPFLYFSGWFVKKLGHFLCFACVYAAFALRLLLYSFLQDPWFVLPIDVLHGVTFGLYHGTMASFAKIKAPSGMEATLLGFFGGLSAGLGNGIGSFVGGLCLDKVGARKTFFSSSILSLVCFLTFLVASYIFKSPTKKEVSPKHRPAEMDECFYMNTF